MVPFWVRCRIVIGIQKGTIILTTTLMSWIPDFGMIRYGILGFAVSSRIGSSVPYKRMVV